MSAVCRKCGRPFDEEIRITAGGEKTICDECGASQESESGILTFDTNHVIEIVGGSGAVRERDFQELPGVGMKKRPPERGGATPDKNTPPDSPRPAPKGTAGRNPVEGKKPPPSPVRRPAVEPERECATPDMNDVALDTPVYGVPNVWEYPMKDESASRDESAGDIEAEPARAHATRDKARGLEDEDDEDLAGAAREEEEEHAPAPRGRSVPDSEVEDVADTRNDEEEEEEERAPLPRGRSVPDSEVEDVADTRDDKEEEEEEEEEEERAPLPRGRSKASEAPDDDEDRPARRTGKRPSAEESDSEDEESSSSEEDPRAGVRRPGLEPKGEREDKKDSVRTAKDRKERTDRSRRSATTGRSRRGVAEEEVAGPAASRWRNPKFLIPFLLLVVLPIVAALLVFLEKIKVFQWPWSDPLPEKIERKTDYGAEWAELRKKYEDARIAYRDGIACKQNIASDSPEDPFRKQAIEHMRECVLLYEEIVKEGDRILKVNRENLREKYKKEGLSAEEADRRAYLDTDQFYGEYTKWERELKDPKDVLEKLEKKPGDGTEDSGDSGTGGGGG